MKLSIHLVASSLAIQYASGFLNSQVALSSRSVTTGKLNSHNTPHHWPPSSPSIMHSDRTTWDEYEHDFVDPLVPHAEKGDMEHVECNAEEEDDCYWVENYFEKESSIDAVDKRDVADKYWLEKFKDDQDKLHHMEHITPPGERVEAEQGSSSDIGKRDTWDHYEHTIDDIAHQQRPSLEAVGKAVKDPMNDEKRAMADEYWAAKNRADKEKMAEMSGMDLLP